MPGKRVYQVLPSKVSVLKDLSQIPLLLESNNISLGKESTLKLLELSLLKLPLSKAFAVVNALYQQGEIKCNENQEYEVETILDHDYDNDEDTTYYLIKWLNWPSEFSTWEPEEGLHNCEEAIEAYKAGIAKCKEVGDDFAGLNKANIIKELLERLSDCVVTIGDLTPVKIFSIIDMLCEDKRIRKSISRKRKQISSKAVNYKRTKAYRLTKAAAENSLAEWEQMINALSNGQHARIQVINNMDLEGQPTEFTYVTDYVAGENVIIPKDPPITCDCTNCYESWKGCCPINNGGSYQPYSKNGKLKAPYGTPIYECNSNCKCGPNCSFRVVQKGQKVKLAIIRTKDRGWGVIVQQKVSKGTFVMEYVGEVVTFEEAERRGKIYDMEAQTYLFDLDFHGDPEYTVDARHLGNVSHFVNHSCDPNLTLRCVYVDCLDVKLPRIALFAARSISRGEELSFDYKMTGATESESMNRSHDKSHIRMSIDDQSVVSSESLNESVANNDEQEPPVKAPIDINLSLQTKENSVDDPDPLLTSPEPNTSNLSPTRLHGTPSHFKKPIKCLCGAKNCRGYLY